MLSFPFSVFYLSTALKTFIKIQAFIKIQIADHPIACLKQICLGERLEGFEEQMILKNSSFFFFFFVVIVFDSISVLKQVPMTADWLFQGDVLQLFLPAGTSVT